MASNIGLYGAFLHNYARATDTVRRCSAHSTQFGEITRDIRLRGFPKGPGLSLEDLLHKPVARVQKNALVLYVSIKYLCYKFFPLPYIRYSISARFLTSDKISYN